MANEATFGDLIINIKSMLDKGGFVLADKAIKKLQKTTNKLSQTQFNRMTTQLKQVGKAGNLVADGLKNARKQATGFQFQWLGIMFAGMALQRFALKAVKGIFEVFNKANEGANELNSMTNKVTGAFEYFKYTIAQALTESPMFQWLIDQLTMVVDWFSGLPEKVKSSIGLTLLAMVPIGGAAMVVGQAMLAWNSILLAKLVHSQKIAATGVTGINKEFSKVKMIGVALTFIGLMDAMGQLLKDKPETLAGIIRSSIVTGLGIWAWTKNPVAGAIAAVMVAIVLTVDKFGKETMLAEARTARLELDEILAGERAAGRDIVATMQLTPEVFKEPYYQEQRVGTWAGIFKKYGELIRLSFKSGFGPIDDPLGMGEILSGATEQNELYIQMLKDRDFIEEQSYDISEKARIYNSWLGTDQPAAWAATGLSAVNATSDVNEFNATWDNMPEDTTKNYTVNYHENHYKDGEEVDDDQEEGIGGNPP